MNKLEIYLEEDGETVGIVTVNFDCMSVKNITDSHQNDDEYDDEYENEIRYYLKQIPLWLRWRLAKMITPNITYNRDMKIKVELINVRTKMSDDTDKSKELF